MVSTTKVTVMILTYNRSGLLKFALESVLSQDYPDFRVVVLDNASTDETESVVGSFADPRVTYLRNETNIGLWRNWNRAIEMNSSPYLSVFHDDDVMLPGFIRESAAVLDQHPSVGFSFALARFIDINGNQRNLQDPGEVPHGVIRGLDFLDLAVDQRDCSILPPTVLLRASALAVAGPLDSPHTKIMPDLNLCLRLATRFDVFFIRKELAQYRVHLEQENQTQCGAVHGIGWYGAMAERIDAIAFLLRSARAQDAAYRGWLAERLLTLHKHQSASMHSFVPGAYHPWAERVELVKQQIAKLIPPGNSFILVDNEQLGIDNVVGDRRRIPFLEKDGMYWGPPPDDVTAVKEFERLWQLGATYMALAWPAFWWLDQYPKLRRYLTTKFRCISQDSQLVVFDLGTDGGERRSLSPQRAAQPQEDRLFEFHA